MNFITKSGAAVTLLSAWRLVPGVSATPEWCGWCLEDELPLERCEDWKNRLGWCVSMYPATMREKCSRTCGYCDECPPGTAEANQRAKDEAAPSPTAFTGEGPNCRPDRKFTGDTDFRTACGDWKRMGYCDEHPDLMHRDCADTCGLCTHPGIKPAPAPVPEDVPVPVPAPLPAPAGVPESTDSDELPPASETDEEEAAALGCTCDRYMTDGAACQAAVGCEWSWDQSMCIPIQGSCESIRKDGQRCIVTPGCAWDWDHQCCVTDETSPVRDTGAETGVVDPCQRIGSDGPTCASTEGCRWDWDTSGCVADSSADQIEVSVKPSSKKSNKGGKRGGGRREKASGGAGAANPCTKLRGKRCSKTASCFLDGKVCRQVPSEDAGARCGQLPRKQCTGSCWFDRTLRKCVASA